MDKYAVIEAKGHQYWVSENDILKVEKFSGSDSKEIKLDHVLLVSDKGETKVGKPFVQNASVVCDVLGDEKQPKVISFKFRRRQGYRRKVGHRQVLTRLRVKSIQAG